MNHSRLKTRLVLGLGAVLLLAILAAVQADTIYLKKGGRIQGVIISESEDSIELKSNLGTIVLSRGAIARIERSTAEEKKALESEWEKEQEEKDKKAKEEKLFEQEQRAKGLVKYKGTWIPAKKMYEIEEEVQKEKDDLTKVFEQQKRELEEMEKRLKEMEARLNSKESELSFREQQLSLREQNLLLQQQNLQRQAEQIAREKEDTPPKIFAVPRIEVVPPRK